MPKSHARARADKNVGGENPFSRGVECRIFGGPIPADDLNAPLDAGEQDLSMSRLPTDSAERKTIPMAAGLMDYFPDALAAVANVSYVGNQQHNPGQPTHWARGKSTDHADCIVRHLIERGTIDTDSMRHSAKLAWRALALLQEELEAAYGLPPSRGSRGTEAPITGR